MKRTVLPARPRFRAVRPLRPRCRLLVIEALERRELLAVLSPSHTLLPALGPGPEGFTPPQIRHAYGFDQIQYASGGVASDGSGQTIAIIVAYDNPSLFTDLDAFSQQFGLPSANIRKINENGGTTLPPTDPTPNGRWAAEASLDVQWAHALAPQASLIVIEADSDSDADMISAAVNTARKIPDVSVVSLSFGTPEFAGEVALDSSFTTPKGHQGVTFVASSGDAGVPPEYPAASPNVLAVGGTTLTLDAANNWLHEVG